MRDRVLQDLVFQTITLASDFDNMSVMQESVDDHARHCLRAEDGVPKAQRVVAGQNCARTLIAVGDDREEHLRLLQGEFPITDLINHQKAGQSHCPEQPLDLSCLECGVDLRDQVAHCDVVDLPALGDGELSQ